MSYFCWGCRGNLKLITLKRLLRGSCVLRSTILIPSRFALDAMLNKRHKECHVVVTTSVTGDGFDLSECQMVVKMDPSCCVNALSQIRSRAWGKETRMVAVCRDEEHFRRIQELLRREEHMRKATYDIAFSWKFPGKLSFFSRKAPKWIQIISSNYLILQHTSWFPVVMLVSFRHTIILFFALLFFSYPNYPWSWDATWTFFVFGTHWMWRNTWIDYHKMFQLIWLLNYSQ